MWLKPQEGQNGIPGKRNSMCKSPEVGRKLDLQGLKARERYPESPGPHLCPGLCPPPDPPCQAQHHLEPGSPRQVGTHCLPTLKGHFLKSLHSPLSWPWNPHCSRQRSRIYFLPEVYKLLPCNKIIPITSTK